MYKYSDLRQNIGESWLGPGISDPFVENLFNLYFGLSNILSMCHNSCIHVCNLLHFLTNYNTYLCMACFTSSTVSVNFSSCSSSSLSCYHHALLFRRFKTYLLLNLPTYPFLSRLCNYANSVSHLSSIIFSCCF